MKNLSFQNLTRKEVNLMKQLILTILFLFAASNLFAQSTYSNTAAGTLLENVVQITAANVSAGGEPVARKTNYVATNFGMAFDAQMATANLSFGTQRIANNAVASLYVILTNKGNVANTFEFDIQSMLSNSAYPWAKTIDGNAFPWATAAVNPGETIGFTLKLDPDNLETNNAFMSIRVVARVVTTNGKQAERYLGNNGIYYGGFVGCDWTGANNNAYYNRAFILNTDSIGADLAVNSTGFMMALIQGPILQITKTLRDIIHPATSLGYADPWAEPGSLITYVIFATNAGTGTATFAGINDTIPQAMGFSNTSLSNGGVNFANWGRAEATAAGTAGATISYTNGAFAAGDSVRIIIRVQVR